MIYVYLSPEKLKLRWLAIVASRDFAIGITGLVTEGDYSNVPFRKYYLLESPIFHFVSHGQILRGQESGMAILNIH